MTEARLDIGELAVQSGVTVRMIRHYLETGLVQEPERSAAGYRKFSPETVRLVTTIRTLQHLGFLHRQIAALLATLEKDQGEGNALDVSVIYEQHREAVRRKAAVYAELLERLEGTSAEGIAGLLAPLREQSEPPG